MQELLSLQLIERSGCRAKMSTEDLDSLSLPQLKALCKKHKLAKCGGKGVTKAYLREKLRKVLEEESSLLDSDDWREIEEDVAANSYSRSEESLQLDSEEEKMLSPPLTEREQVFSQISDRKWTPTSAIVTATGLSSKQVNRLLYNLLAEKRVVKQAGPRGTKPEWKLASREKPKLVRAETPEKDKVALSATLDFFPLVPGDSEAERLRQGYAKLTFQGEENSKVLDKLLKDVSRILKAAKAPAVKTEAYALAVPRGAHMKKVVAAVKKAMSLGPVPPELYETPAKVTGQPAVPEVAGDKEELNTLSEFFGKDLKNYEKFRGNYLYKWGWLLYLEELLSKQSDAVSVCRWGSGPADPGVFYQESKKQLTVSAATEKRIAECLVEGKRFIIGVMSISSPAGGHANSLIFDSENKVLTRFEPHGGSGTGKSFYSQQILDRKLAAWLTAKYPDWRYNRPADFCPVPGPQTKEDADFLGRVYKKRKVFGKERLAETRGFCQAWSLLYIHMRITNPSYSDEEVVERMLAWSDSETAEKIRRYAEFIVQEIDPTTYANKRAISANSVVAYAAGRGMKRQLGFVTSVTPKIASLLTYPDWVNTRLRLVNLQPATTEEEEKVRAALKKANRLKAFPAKNGKPATVLAKLTVPKRTVVGIIQPGSSEIRGWVLQDRKAARRARLTLDAPVDAEVIKPGHPLYKKAQS